MVKKTKTLDDTLQTIINDCPYSLESKFIKENFTSESGSGYPRHMIETINRLRKIDSELKRIDDEYTKNLLLEEKEHIQEYLQSQDIVLLKNAISNWEESEPDYWVNYLGKLAAIELLTYGKPTMDTMNKMVRLPEELYVKSTQICVRLANAIKQATVDAETAIGIDDLTISNASGMHTPQAPTKPGPRKLNLKKVVK